MLLLAAFIVFLQVGNPVVSPPASSTTTVQNNITLTAPPPDPEVVAESANQSFQAIVVSQIAPAPVGFANDLLGLPDIWRQTPENLTVGHPAINSLAGIVLAAALSLVALAIFTLGMSHALGERPAYGRLIFAIVMSLGNITWWTIGIRMNNAINSSFGAPELPTLIRPHLDPSPLTNMAGNVGAVFLLIVYACVAIMLLFSLLFRLGLIQVLIVIGPLALICYATPWSEGFAQLYTRLSVGLLFSQVMIVVGMRLAEVLGGLGTGALGTLLSLMILLQLRRLPGLLSSATSSNGGGSAVGKVLMLRRLVGIFV